MEEIDIKDLDAFIKNNEEIENMLEKSAEEAADVVSNISYISEQTSNINSELHSLKHVSVPDINDGSNLKNKLDNMVDNYNNSMVSLIVALKLAEAKINDYNSGAETSTEAESLFNQIMQGTTDSNVYWIANEVLKDSKFGAAAFVLAYGTDAQYENGDFLVGDGVSKLAETIIEDISEKELIQSGKIFSSTAGIGSAAVAVYTIAKDIYTDEGEYTPQDIARTGLDSATSAANYGSWVAISSAVGGVPGVIAASAASFVLVPVGDAIKDTAVGDNIIDTFERNGQVYEVPRNGTGAERSYDVLFERYSNEMNKEDKE